MAAPNNVELEAAKFLHKLIQESTDEPIKLATKLYVILQHMKSSGKENSMPYQVISRAMETVINQHGLDIEVLKSSRLPPSGGNQLGDSSSSQYQASTQMAGIKDSKASLSENEMSKIDSHVTNRPPVGPSGAAHNIYQGSVSHLSGTASKIHGPMPGISNPVHFSSASYDNHSLASKTHKEKSKEGFSSPSSVEISADAQFLLANHGEVANTNLSTGKALEREGGTSNTLASTNKITQDSIRNNVTEMSMVRNATPRDTGKSPVSQGPGLSGMPFKEQHLKQLRAQCLVFLAFRNGLMPKKLHLEIALGNFFPKEDILRKEMAENKGKELSINEPSSIHEVAKPLGGLHNTMEAERTAPGSSCTGPLLGPSSTSKGQHNQKFLEGTNTLPSIRSDSDLQPPSRKIVESQPFITKGSQPDSLGAKESPVSNHGDDLGNRTEVVMANQTSTFMSMNKQMKPEMNWTRTGSHEAPDQLLLPSSFPYGSVPKDNVGNQSQIPVDYNLQGNQHADGHLPSFPSREHWKPITGMNDERNTGLPVKDANGILKHVNEVETDQEEEDASISTPLPPSPKYTTSEKWISYQQKRKLLFEQNWALKQRKTEKKITTRFDKLKDIVSSSDDISAKTKSVIELKKLQLLELQRRLKSDILNDFFKPIANDMDHLKSIKKHRIGRRSKQLERYEQKMKEERQKRIRERQKEFFSEIEVHKERLDDIFKVKRERWRGFNKYVREFHKRKERIHREKIDRIQREKINLLKINDVEGYLRMVQDAKSDRVNKLLKETEKYLQKLGSKLQEAKGESRTASTTEKNEFVIENEEETDQAKHYMESNEKYYLMAHSVKESVAEQPTSLVGGKLREYQMNGLRWLVSLYNNHLNGILADEMGLGKTVQVISLICYLMETKNDRGPFLVVVPSSVLPGWESELNFWAPSVLKIVYAGPPEERRRLFKERIVHQKFNVLLTTYEYLMNKHDRPKLSKVDWHYIIIDEGHRIKNASCKLNADLKLYRSSHRLLLTGTPLQNNLEELWALLNFLLPNIFNSSEDFSQWFNKPFEGNGDNSPDEALLSEEENLLIINRLHQVLRPFVLRRLKHKVENELPEKIERLVRCEASAYQKLLMKRVEENLGAIGTSKARSVHNTVMELRNICNHPYLSQLHVEEVHSYIPKHYLPHMVRLCGKLEMLDRLLPKLKATDHRVLLFSTMTRLLDVMEDYLYWKQYRYLRLDGHTSGGDRGALIDQFNKPGSPFFIFLLSIRAGGVGVNLQAADTVIIFDTDWNPQVDLQAQARAHRIGQKKDVLVLRLETVQTVEEQVRASAEHKLGVANQSITAGFFDNNTSAEDRREYLESLLRECKKEEAAPVLDDDALNDLIARSESEIDVFESIDKQRKEEEMAAWKELISEDTDVSEHEPSLPSRLLTDDDLKSFYEAMKITEVSSSAVVSNVGLKRKSGQLGGPDTQHYGRGKRAREVRSYEEQWTEEEFEKLCQAESPDSPKPKEEVIENNMPIVASGSIAVIAKTEPSESPTLLLQPNVVQQTLPNIVVTPPSKRGRGRPKRATADISPSPMLLPATSGVVKMDEASQKGIVPSLPPGFDTLPASTLVKGGVGTIQQSGVWIAPSSQSIVPVSSAAPGSEVITPARSITMQVKGQIKNIQTAPEPPRHRGKKQAMVSPEVPGFPAPSGICKPEMGPQLVTVSSSPVTPSSDSVSGAANAKGASDVQTRVSPVIPEPPALSGSSTLDDVSQQGVLSHHPVANVPVSLSGLHSVSGISGTVNHHVIGVGPSSQPISPLPTVPFGSQSVPVYHPVPSQGRGRGRKPQGGVETPRRRGRKQALVSPAVPDGHELKLNEQPQKRTRLSGGRKVNVAKIEPQTELQQQTNVIQTPALKVPTAVQYSTSAEQSDNTAQNRERTSSSAMNEGASCSSDKKSAALPAEVEASESCRDPTIGKTHVIDVKEVVATIEIHSKPLVSDIKVDDCKRSEVRQTPSIPASSDMLVEVANDQNLDNKSSSALHASELVVPVSGLPSGKSENQTEKDGVGGKLSEEKIAVTDDALVSKPKLCEPEVKSISSAINNTGNSGQLTESTTVVDGSMEVTCGIPLVIEASEVHSSVPKMVGSSVSDIRDSPTLPRSGTVSFEVTGEQIIHSAVENLKPIEHSDCSLQIKEQTSSSTTGDGATGSLDKKSASKDGVLPTEVEASESCGDPIKEQISIADVKDVAPKTVMEVQSETPLPDTEKDYSLTSVGGVAPSSLVSSAIVPKVVDDQNLEKETSLALSTSETSAPVCDVPVENSENQSAKECGAEVVHDQGLDKQTSTDLSASETSASICDFPGKKCENQSAEEGDAKVKDKLSIMDEALESKPELCEPKSEIASGSVENTGDLKQLTEDSPLVVGGNVDVACDVLPVTKASEVFSHGTEAPETLESDSGVLRTVPKMSATGVNTTVQDSKMTEQSAICAQKEDKGSSLPANNENVVSSDEKSTLVPSENQSVEVQDSKPTEQSDDSAQKEEQASSLPENNEVVGVSDEKSASVLSER